MARSKRLNSVAKLMNHRQQEAAKRLGYCAQQLEQQRQSLHELEVYRNEYLHSFQNNIQAGISMSRVNDYHQFIVHLDQAISQQQQNVYRADKEYASCRQEWLSRRCSVKAMDKVVSRYQAQEQQLEGKREQHENDESSRNAKGHDWVRKSAN